MIEQAEKADLLASMRPRSFDRGNAVIFLVSVAERSCFNEAAIFRSRKHRGPKGGHGLVG